MVVVYNKCKEGLDWGALWETAQISKLEHDLAPFKSFPPQKCKFYSEKTAKVY